MPVSKLILFLIRHILFACAYLISGFFIAAILFLYSYIDSLPTLKPWHTTSLTSEYASSDQQVDTLAEYLALETTLFAELNQSIYNNPALAEQNYFSRYRHDGPLDPTHYSVNWNRTQHLQTTAPKAGFLLLHGLSDSPYSLHQLAETLHSYQTEVVALRLPGHGTTPAGLLTVTANDFKQAVRLGARALRQRIGNASPLYIVGYSNGATLAIEYALARLEGEDIPGIDGLILISPAVSVSEFASLAAWQRRLSRVPGLEQLAWHTLQPEYDPYKYNSFTLNAAEQIFHLTRDNQRRIDALASQNRLQAFPPVLAFLSTVDATVSVDAVVNDFLGNLPPNNHHLVMYDVNREQYSSLLFSDSTQGFPEALLSRSLPFSITVLTNAGPESRELIAKTKVAQHSAVEQLSTTLSWPDGIYSLSHVALPFSPKDPVYGEGNLGGHHYKSLGNLTLRGERGVFRIPDSQLIRLRFNPFYALQETLILQRVNLGTDSPGEKATN